MTKLSDKSQLSNIPQDTWPVFLKTVKVTKNKRSVRKCHSQEEDKETRQLNVIWYPGWDPGAEKGHQQKTSENQIKN